MAETTKVKEDKKKSMGLGEIQASTSFAIPSSNANPRIKASEWPLLLKNFDRLNTKTSHHTAIVAGCSPLQRPIKGYVSFGFINLDKPSNPTSHEVATWIKNILGVEKTGHSGALDPNMTGCLIVCIDRATRLVKSQQSARKEYVAVFCLHSPVEDVNALDSALRP